MSIIRVTDLDLAGERVLIRLDLNVPIRDGEITSDARIRASLPSIEQARKSGAKVLLMSHLGRPVEGEHADEFSLRPVARRLTDLLGVDVRMVEDYLDHVDVAAGEVVLLENVRFNVGEKEDDDRLARRYAGLCDIYVMDAFGTVHRAQASTYGVMRYAPIACAGMLLTAELDALGKALHQPARPLIAIVGGSKVSTKLNVLTALSDVVDQLIPGGGIANTFSAAEGYPVGRSLYEPDLLPRAEQLLAATRKQGGDIPVPSDVVVASEFSESAVATVKTADMVEDNDMILDIGPATAARYAEMLSTAGTIVWNGPVGVFEFDQFGGGTATVARAVADSDAFSIAGGGDTLAAIDKYGVTDKISYTSTGGGAFLEFIEGKKLPAIEILKQRSSG